MENELKYCVVLQGTGEEGSNYKDIRTFRCFSSQEEFEEME